MRRTARRDSRPGGNGGKNGKRFPSAQDDDFFIMGCESKVSVYAALQHFFIGRFHIIKSSFVF
jgi:hypothetical protein